MKATLDIIAEVGADGRISDSAARAIRANLRQRAAGLDASGTVDVRVQIGAPLRSTRANRLYWAVLGRIALGYLESGRPYHTDALHLWFKGLYLPGIAAEIEAETGEVLDVVREIGLPNGRTVTTLTTTALTREAFSMYIERIAADDDVLALGLDLSDILGETAALRSGSVAESSELATVPFENVGGVWTMADL